MTRSTSTPSPAAARPTARPGRRLRGLGYAALALAALVVAYLLVGWPLAARWGATAEETRRTLPGDDLVPGATMQTTRAITIKAAPETIYPWLVQMGVDRGGLYSYEWLENLIGLRVRNADRVHLEWQDTTPGDFIRYTPRDYPLNPGPGMWVMAMEPGRALITCNGLETEIPEPCTSSITYVLEPAAPGETRLIVRDRFNGGMMARLWQAVPFIMERGQLLGLRGAVERAG
jgi:hypothetical protein